MNGGGGGGFVGFVSVCIYIYIGLQHYACKRR
jgi:hypothetical protein